jgi:mannosyltransferase OCH1-like enzyme
MSNNHPLISCLCVTKNSYELVEQSIDCFLFQTYPNKELIILSESDNIDIISELINKYKIYNNIKFFKVPIIPKKTLGELRNISISLSNGEYIAQWDDDDIYHPDRLLEQFNMILKDSKGNVLYNNIIIYNKILNKACIFNNYAFDGSMLVHKQSLTDVVEYPSINKGEDSHVRNHLLNNRIIKPVILKSMYLYRFHNNNTWNMEHFEKLCNASTRLNGIYTRYIAACHFLPEANFVKAVLHSIDNKTKPEFNKTISKIIHQVWKTRHLPEKYIKLTEKWKELHPEYTFKIWTDDDCNDFIDKVYPVFKQKWESFLFPIQRFDAIRYLILKTYGGIYIDLDMFPLKTLNFLDTENFIVSKESNENAKIHNKDFILSNAFMASPPNHIYLTYLINDIMTYKTEYTNRNNIILDTTGPFLLGRVYDKHPDKVSILNQNYFMPYTYIDIERMVKNNEINNFYRGATDAYAIHMYDGNWWKKEIETKNYIDIFPKIMTETEIPKILHFTWKEKEIPDKLKVNMENIKKLHPLWEIIIWTDEEMDIFVNKNGTEKQYNKYCSYKKMIQRCDYFRVFVIYIMGGIYLDLDIIMNKSFDDLYNGVVCFFPCEKVMTKRDLEIHKNRDAIRIGNYAMGGVKNHKFFKHIVDSFEKIEDMDTEIHNNILETTGPGFLTTIYHDYIDKSDITIIYPSLMNISFKYYDCVRPSFVGDYGYHFCMGTWR